MFTGMVAGMDAAGATVAGALVSTGALGALPRVRSSAETTPAATMAATIAENQRRDLRGAFAWSAESVT
jgi:hypothetical protein